jgi:hypothetical protein
MSSYSIVRISDRKGFLEKAKADLELLKCLRGNPDISKLYDEVLKYPDPNAIPDKIWHEFELESAGAFIDRHPLGLPQIVRRTES